MSARRIVANAFASLIVLTFSHTASLAAGKPDKPTPATPSKADDLFFELSSNGKVDDAKAKFSALRALADQGDARAIAFTAALAYTLDNDIALDYSIKGLSSPPTMVSQVHLIQGFRCNGGFNERKAAEKAAQLAQAPDASASAKQVGLIIQGLLYEYGGGGFTVSKAQALEYFQKAAASGSAFALTLQGRLYEFDGGKEIPVDKAKATALYKAGADKGDPHGWYAYGTMKLEEGDRKAWEAAMRRALELGMHEGAAAELGYDLVTRPGATKPQIEEGLRLLDAGNRLRGTYAMLKLGQLAEADKLPGIDTPVGVAYVLYRKLSDLPCGSPDGPDAIAKLWPRLQSQPDTVLAKLNGEGMYGIAQDLIDHFGGVKSLRDAIWAWALVPHEVDEDYVSYLADSKVHQSLELLLSTAYARMRFDPPADLQSPDRFARELAGAFRRLADGTDFALTDLGQTHRIIDERLAANTALDADSRLAYARAIKAGLDSANEALKAEYARRTAPPPPKPEELAAAKSCYDLTTDHQRRKARYDERREQFDEERAALDSESDSIDNERLLVEMQIGVTNNFNSMGYKNTDNGSTQAAIDHYNNRLRAYNRANEQLNKRADRLNEERDRLNDDAETIKDRCFGRKFNSQAITQVCGDTPSNSSNEWCAGFDD